MISVLAFQFFHLPLEVFPFVPLPGDCPLLVLVRPRCLLRTAGPLFLKYAAVVTPVITAKITVVY